MFDLPPPPLHRPRKRIFLLSPAQCGGERARLLRRRGAHFDLAARLRRGESVPLGELMSFVSGLYFRGKAAYALTFAMPPRGLPGALVITPNEGLLPLDAPVDRHRLARFAAEPIALDNPRYCAALDASAGALARSLVRRTCDVVLLGSLASPKYTAILIDTFGVRLAIPPIFIGCGDMRRGSLLLRAVRTGKELDYARLADLVKARALAAPGRAR